MQLLLRHETLEFVGVLQKGIFKAHQKIGTQDLEMGAGTQNPKVGGGTQDSLVGP